MAILKTICQKLVSLVDSKLTNYVLTYYTSPANKIFRHSYNETAIGVNVNRDARENIDIGWRYDEFDGSGLGLRSSVWNPNDSTDAVNGSFSLYARKNSTDTYALNGYSDGTLSWGGDNNCIVPPIGNSATTHNAIYRGKNLGTSLTSTQSTNIQNGTFKDMYIGDYWEINGVTWRIVAFDYYYNCGDGYNAETNPTGSVVTTHHIVIMPDSYLYTAQMNSENVTTGAYVGSEMYSTNINQAKTTINNAFGSTHILSIRQYFHNATNSTYGFTTAGAWTDETVWLPNENNVYGCKIYSNTNTGNTIPNNYTIDNRQFPLFRFQPRLTNPSNTRYGYWLRDVCSSSTFCNVSNGGHANYHYASNSYGVRPVFCII